jgi:tagatose-6-phosphate ketose/aldose isomerase
MASLGREDSDLQGLGALWTAREIAQQPAMLRKTQDVLDASRDALDRFLRPLVEHATVRLILTGAGTSAFIGECLAPDLAAKLPCRVEAIATTDLVSAPRLYFDKRAPTLLVSFARSGNSPESVAAVDLANQLVGDIHHLAITCNAEGALVRQIATAGRSMTILLPEEAHDRSFAMTSSFTCMMYAALAALTGIETMQPRAGRIAGAMESVLAAQTGPMKALAGNGYERVVYLGSGGFKGLAREAALKLLELTDGGMVAVHDSPMGFRHGPKTIVTGKTLVTVFLSSDAYTRRYDLDLLEEIVRDRRAGSVLAIAARDDGLPAGIERVIVPAMQDAADVDLLFPFIVAPQLFAFEASLARGISPDNPNVTGTVNRVVQGVRIHPLR